MVVRTILMRGLFGMDATPSLDTHDLTMLVAARASRTPDAEMACQPDGERITYGEFAERVARVAVGAATLGVGAGTRTSWSLPTSIDALVLSAALHRVGAVQNPIIPIYREREFRFCVQQVGSTALFVPGTWRGFDYQAMAERLRATMPSLEVVDCSLGLPEGDPATWVPLREAQTDEPRWVFYTSGTTADPKGALHRDASLSMIADGIAARYEAVFGDRASIAFPYTHIGGVTWLFLTLRHGVVLLLDPVFDPVTTTRYLAREGVTHAGSGTPFHMAYLAAQREHPSTPLFPHLKNCPGGGAPKPPEIHYEVRRELGGAGVVSGWGLTEAPILTTARHDDDDHKLATTEGFGLPGVELIAVRSDGTRAAPGEEGELRAKAPQMMVGYVDVSLNDAAFDADGYFRTGDLGTVDDDGYVTITGRLKDVIIRNGENISPKEVEDLLYTHPKVRDVAVIGLPDPQVGERACAVVCSVHADDALTFAEMQTFLREHHIRTQAIPERLELVDEVPRNATGKITKNVLRSRFG